jgi:hypothetical protein
MRFAEVHASGSGWVKDRFSGSGLVTSMEHNKDLDAMSPAGAILFPVNSITVREGTVSCSETPRTRSVYSAEVSARSRWGH